MELRIDSATGLEWRNVVAQPVTDAPLRTRELPDTDIRREFAEKLTRLSAVLGVLTHMVRVDELREDERIRFHRSVQLAEHELTQASDSLRDTRRSIGANAAGFVDVGQLLTLATKRLQDRLEKAGLECEVHPLSILISCDALALKSLFVGMTQYAFQMLQFAPSMSKRIVARLTEDASSIHFTILTNGPACADSDLERSDSQCASLSECLDRCMQLASVLGGSLSVRRPIQGSGLTLRYEMPKFNCSVSGSMGSNHK